MTCPTCGKAMLTERPHRHEPSAEADPLRGVRIVGCPNCGEDLSVWPSAEADAGWWGSLTPQQQLDAYRAALSRPATPPLDVSFVEGVVSTALYEYDVDNRAARHVMDELRAALANPDPETT